MQATATKPAETWSPADLKWGFRFGCDGSLDWKEAAARLGNISRTTLWRLGVTEKIRVGEVVEGRTVYCVRSITEYLATRER